MSSEQKAQHFEPSPVYWVGASFGALVMVGFAWELGRAFTVEGLFFCLVGIGLLLWSLAALGKRVRLTNTGLCVEQPFQRPRCVEFRQLLTVNEEGRFNPVITLVYHPALANGLLDLDAAVSVELPALRAQNELLTVLQERQPR